MSKRKPIDKTLARERRNRLLDSAAAAELSLTEGVREMRAISGMTQEEFAQHRGVSARVIKAIELGQGNPTMATLNRIGEFFGLEVAFVPIRRAASARIDKETTSTPDPITVETIMAGKKAFDEYLDKLAAYVKEFGLTNIPSDPDDIIKAKKSKLSTPAKTSSNKKKDRAP